MFINVELKSTIYVCAVSSGLTVVKLFYWSVA